jgi:ABC-type transport system involved in multi-copper enzyme maturation permease subunit
MIFATTMILEREPMLWADFPRSLLTWVQTAGALASFVGLLWLLVQWLQRRQTPYVIAVPTIAPFEHVGRAALAVMKRVPIARMAILGFILSWIGYVGVAGLWLVNFLGNNRLSGLMPTLAGRLSLGDWLLFFAGGCALATVATPVAVALVTRIRWGRIWAMARLSLKEAIRSKVVWIFGLLFPVFLFASWFIPYKPQYQVANYVFLLYLSIAVLFLMTASLLGAFGIPTDVKSQSIHTIVTKPVEKFEVVLGRFLGYAILTTVGLAVVTAASMLYLARGITEEARHESFKARVPVYGRLLYHGTKDEFKGENVGRVYDVRGYITGMHPNQPGQKRQYAVWTFQELPVGIGGSGRPVRIEFGFDIFRLTKGVENQGVLCTFVFADGRVSVTDLDTIKLKLKTESDKLQEAARKKHSGDPKALATALHEIDREMLEKHRVHVVAGFNVTDYHTQAIDVPATLFQRLDQLEASEPRPTTEVGTAPMFQVAVSVDFDARGANQQMLGVARTDLYLLAAENWFPVNFVKGIVGIWCLMMLVLGIAVACSTYLSGIISWLATVFLVLAGLFITDIQNLAEHGVGGGPIAAAARLLQKTPEAMDLDDTTGTAVINTADLLYRWFLRRFLNLVPDVTRFNLYAYVANGFDIPWGQVLFLDNILPLLGYLVPWGILAFYLMKYREIANPM